MPLSPGRERWAEHGRAALPFLLHGATTACIFFKVLFLGQVLYFRDLSTQFYPDAVFVAKWLRRGVWPLWNPHVDGGSPWLAPYPPDLLLLWLAGPGALVTVIPALHVFLAMAGATLLGRQLGMGRWGSWLCGSVYGLSGFVLSSVNLLPLLQSEAWAPWVVAAALRAVERPEPRRIAVLALLVALQVSTLGVEIVLLQSLVAAALIQWPRLSLRTVGSLVAAAALAAALLAPVIAGMRTTLEGSRRSGGFTAAEAMAFSLHPLALSESVLPRFLGDVHGLTDRGFWGQPLFPEGFPYILSLYLGPAVLLIAARGCRGRWPLVVLAACGAVLGLGSWGPLGLPGASAWSFRAPVKLLYLATFAVALLAGFGFDRIQGAPSRRMLPALPPLLLLGAAAAALLSPGAAVSLVTTLVPAASPERVGEVARDFWPAAFASSAVLALASVLCAMRRGSAPAAAVLAVADLLLTNAAINPTAPPAFYALRPEVAAAVHPRARPDERWFSYGVANTPGLQWSPVIARSGGLVWAYYLDRQTLLPRFHEIEGLDGVFDADRTGWAPRGSTLEPAEQQPAAYALQHRRMRGANVRWLLSFFPLPADLTRLAAEVPLVEVQHPLRLYEVNDPIPRAFWARDEIAAARVASGESPFAANPDVRRLDYAPVDPHRVTVRSVGEPGEVVVLDAYHRDWRVVGPGGEVPVRRALGRHLAWATAGGPVTWQMQYRPRWRAGALGAAAAAGALLVLLAFRPGSGPLDPPSDAKVAAPLGHRTTQD